MSKGEIEACKKEIAELKERIEKARGDPDGAEPCMYMLPFIIHYHII
jgi:hypothetical protein